MMDRTFKVEGMHCRSCGMLIEDVVKEVDGVIDASADNKAGTVSISARDQKSIDGALEAIEKEGYKVIRR